MHVCTPTHTSGPVSRRGTVASQPERRQENVVSDHLIGLAPDRQRSPCQPVRGPELTPQSYFGWGWLHAVGPRKVANLEPQSICLCHRCSLFKHSLTVFTSRHVTLTHTLGVIQTHPDTERNQDRPNGFLLILNHLFTHLVQQFSSIGDTDT